MGSPRHPIQAAKGAAWQRALQRQPLFLAPLLWCMLFGSVVGSKHTGRSTAAVQPAQQGIWGQNYQEVMGLFDLDLHVAGAVLPVIAANSFQVVKVQLQSSSAPSGRSAAVVVARTIFERDGIKGFFRGLSPALVGIGPAIFSHGLVYFVMKQITTGGAWSGERNGDLTELLCGSAAILAQNIVTNPIGMIQTRMQLGSDSAEGRITSWRGVVQSILEGEGFGGFYKGLWASCLRCSENLIVFTLRGRLDIWLKNRQVRQRAAEGGLLKGLRWKKREQPVPQSHTRLPYMMAKLAAMLVTYPFEVVRTRQREQARKGYSKYKGVRQSLYLIGKEEGLRGLYAGAGTHLARVVIGWASLGCLEWYGRDVFLSILDEDRSRAFVERLPEALPHAVGFAILHISLFLKIMSLIVATAVTIMPENRPGPSSWPM